ncbi:MAG TPA: hypothetical protein VHM67_14305 [Gemmatimonadaceae bacterium]|nr:hypothetical protein [Gemmatimonadaceae bacterium]
MADDTDRDTTRERPTDDETPPPPRRRKRWGLRILTMIVLLPAILIALWIGIALNWSYSEGNRAGYLQKFSRKGWICKTWEGEIAMINLPGSTPQIFAFTVRDERAARELERLMGRRVEVRYQEHRGVPTSCFGETRYYVVAAHEVPEFGLPTIPTPAPAQPGTSATPTPAPTPAPPPR